MDIRSRLAWAGALALSPLLPLTARLAYLQVFESQVLQSRAADAMERVAQDASPRADIVDRNGRVLAKSIPSWSCFIDKPSAKAPQTAARRLARILGLPPDGILRELKGRHRFLKVKEGMSYEEAAAVEAERLPGVGVTSGHRRVYPNDGLAQSVIGTVSADGQGLSGVELAFDRELRREAGRRAIFRDGAGKTVFRGGNALAAAPEPLVLTIDRNFQFFAEEALAGAVARHGVSGGLVAVQDPSTGEILALASYPSSPLRNAAVQDAYEPGSTFKLVTAAAALGESLVGEEETIFCENGTWEAAKGVSIRDHEPEGNLGLAGIIAKSSNIGAAKIAERVGAMRFYRYCQAFGFLNKTGVGLPGETQGSLKPLAGMSRVSLLTASYGYGVAVSPLQLLGAYSAIANDGILLEPAIVRSGREPVRVRRVVPEPVVRRLVSLLEGVVERGTGVTARIPGYRVAGKTGTARKLDPSTKQYYPDRYVASFVGFVPVEKPRFTILVVLDDPKGGSYYGSQVAAPVFMALAKQYLTLRGVPPSAPAALATSPAPADAPRRLAQAF